MKYFLFFLVACMCICGFAKAQKTGNSLPLKATRQQDDTSAITLDKKRLFINPGVTYISNLTYEGRKAANSTPVLTPYINLILQQGFFLSAAGYINAGGGLWGVEGAGITPGYVFQLGKHFNGFLSATKYFFDDSSSLILSSLKGSADAGVDFQSAILNAGLSLDYLIGDTHDLIVGSNIGKTLEWKNIFRAVTLKAEPTASFSMGSQSFYETYYTHTILKRQASSGSSPRDEGPLGGLLESGQTGSNDPDIITETVAEKKQREVHRFRPLNISFYLPVTVHIHKLQLSFTPNIAFPFNQVNLDGGQSSTRLNQAFFFYSAGISLLL